MAPSRVVQRLVSAAYFHSYRSLGVYGLMCTLPRIPCEYVADNLLVMLSYKLSCRGGVVMSSLKCGMVSLLVFLSEVVHILLNLNKNDL